MDTRIEPRRGARLPRRPGNPAGSTSGQEGSRGKDSRYRHNRANASRRRSPARHPRNTRQAGSRDPKAWWPKPCPRPVLPNRNRPPPDSLRNLDTSDRLRNPGHGRSDALSRPESSRPDRGSLPGRGVAGGARFPGQAASPRTMPRRKAAGRLRFGRTDAFRQGWGRRTSRCAGWHPPGDTRRRRTRPAVGGCRRGRRKSRLSAARAELPRPGRQPPPRPLCCEAPSPPAIVRRPQSRCWAARQTAALPQAARCQLLPGQSISLRRFSEESSRLPSLHVRGSVYRSNYSEACACTHAPSAWNSSPAMLFRLQPHYDVCSD